MTHVTDRQQKLVEGLLKLEEPGQTLKRALTEAGYSQYSSNQGWAAVPNKVVRLLAKKGMRLRELGNIDAETQEQLVRGRLVYNVIKGSDKGVMSAKALGSERRVNMFTPDSQTGVIILQAPTAAKAILGEDTAETKSST